jgi:hypothetical protein
MRLQAITAGKRTFAAVAAQRWATQPRQEETAHHAPVGAPPRMKLFGLGLRHSRKPNPNK